MSTRHPFNAGLAEPSVSSETTVTYIYGFTPKARVRPFGQLSVISVFLFLVHDHPSMVSVIMVMHITGRNEFKCFVRLFELWFPICGSTCCLCVLSHVVASDEHNPQPTCRGVRRTCLASHGGGNTGCFFSLLWLQLLSQNSIFSFCDAALQCVFLMWNN